MTQLPEVRYQFGDVILDVLNLKLTVSGVQRALEPKSFRLLQFLVENRTRVVPAPQGPRVKLSPGPHVFRARSLLYRPSAALTLAHA